MCYLLCRGGCSLGFEAPVIVARGQCGSSAWAVAHCVAACGVGFHVAVVVQVYSSLAQAASAVKRKVAARVCVCFATYVGGRSNNALCCMSCGSCAVARGFGRAVCRLRQRERFQRLSGLR